MNDTLDHWLNQFEAACHDDMFNEPDCIPNRRKGRGDAAASNSELEDLADAVLTAVTGVAQADIVEQLRLRRTELREAEFGRGDTIIGPASNRVWDTEFYIELGDLYITDDEIGSDPELHAWLAQMETAAEGSDASAAARLDQFKTDYCDTVESEIRAVGEAYNVTLFTGDAHLVTSGSNWHGHSPYVSVDRDTELAMRIQENLNQIAVYPVPDPDAGTWTWKVA